MKLLLVVALSAVLCLAQEERTVEECQAMTKMLDFAHVEGGDMAHLTKRVCIKFDWLAVEYRLKPALYKQWVKNEQFGVAIDDILATSSLRSCFRNYLRTNSAEEALDFWQDTQNFRALSDAERLRDACRIFRTFVAENSPSPVKLAGATRAGLTELFQTTCAEKLDELEEPPKRRTFAQANAEAKELLTQHVVGFMSEDAFKQCKSSSYVKKDVRRYSAMKARYCDDEMRAYQEGTPERKRRTQDAIRTSLSEHCETDPNFNMNLI